MKDTPLYHYSEKLITQLDPNFWRDKVTDFERQIKPLGFWVSAEGFEGDINWPEWAISERFYLNRLAYRYRVVIPENYNVLVLKSPLDITYFTKTYENLDSQEFGCFSINWQGVQNDYDGLIITPYQWDCRYSYLWYYHWDCSSGCIWKLDGLKLMLDKSWTCPMEEKPRGLLSKLDSPLEQTYLR